VSLSSGGAERAAACALRETRARPGYPEQRWVVGRTGYQVRGSVQVLW